MRRTRMSCSGTKRFGFLPECTCAASSPALFVSLISSLHPVSASFTGHNPQPMTHGPPSQYNNSLQLFSDEATNIDLRSLWHEPNRDFIAAPIVGTTTSWQAEGVNWYLFWIIHLARRKRPLMRINRCYQYQLY